jgi:hypothetical protein
MIHLSSKQLRHAANIKDKIDSLHSTLNKILGYVIDHGSPAKAIHRKRRKMSAAARAKISAAAKARWAKVRAKKK